MTDVHVLVTSLTRISQELSETLEMITVQWMLVSEEISVFQTEEARLKGTLLEASEKEQDMRDQVQIGVLTYSSVRECVERRESIEQELGELRVTFEELKDERSRQILVYLDDAGSTLSNFLFGGVFGSSAFVDYLYAKNRAADRNTASGSASPAAYLRPPGTGALEEKLLQMQHQLSEFVSLLASMSIEPIPTPETQCACISLLEMILSRSRPLITEEEWDKVFSECSLAATLEVAFSSAFGSLDASHTSSFDQQHTRLISAISRCLFVSCTISGTLASDVLTSDSHLKTLLSCLRALGEQLDAMGASSQRLTLTGGVLEDADVSSLNSLSDAVCNILATLHILCRLADAAPILTSVHAHHDVVALFELVVSRPAIDGFPTICGMAIQLLNEMTETSFEGFGRLLMEDQLCRVLCIEVIARSPWGPLVEAGCNWLRTCLTQLRLHCIRCESEHMERGANELLHSTTKWPALCHNFIEKITWDLSLVESLLALIRGGESVSAVGDRAIQKHTGDRTVTSPTLHDIPSLSGRQATGAEGEGHSTMRCAASAAACLEALLLAAPFTMSLPHLLLGKAGKAASSGSKPSDMSFHRHESNRSTTLSHHNKPLQFIATITSMITCHYFRVLAKFPHENGRPSVNFDSIMLVQLAHIVSLVAAFSPTARAHVAHSLGDALSLKALGVLWAGIELGFALSVSVDGRGGNRYHADNWLVFDARGVLLNNLYAFGGSREHEQAYPAPSMSKSCVNLEATFEKQEDDWATKQFSLESYAGQGTDGAAQQLSSELTVGVLYCAAQRAIHMACDRVEVLSGKPRTASDGVDDHLKRAVESAIQRAVEARESSTVGATSSPHRGDVQVKNRAQEEVSLKANLALVTSLAHHYAGNAAKLRHVANQVSEAVHHEVEVLVAKREAENARRNGRSTASHHARSGGGFQRSISSQSRSNRQRRSSSLSSGDDSDSGTDGSTSHSRIERLKSVKGVHQSERVWSVCDMRQSDLVVFAIPLFASVYDAAARRTVFEPVSPGSQALLQNYSLRHMVSALRDHGEVPVSKHILFLHKELEGTPLSWHRRRCLINDLYTHVYPKVLLFIRYIMQTLVERGDEAGRPLFLFIASDRGENSVNAANLEACYHFAGRMV